MSNWALKLLQRYHKLRGRLYHIPIDSKLYQLWNNVQLNFRQRWDDLDYLVVDTETSALNTEEGELLSIGWVTIKQGEIQLNDARHYYIKGLMSQDESVGESAAIHQIRDCELQQGIYIEEAVSLFLETCQNKVLVFHHAGLDLAFLNKHVKHLMGAPLLIPHVDTILLEKQKLSRQKSVLKKQDLTLASCRTRYGLPDYPAHNALNDALATAELLIAQIKHKGNIVKGKELFVS